MFGCDFKIYFLCLLLHLRWLSWTIPHMSSSNNSELVKNCVQPNSINQLSVAQQPRNSATKMTTNLTHSVYVVPHICSTSSGSSLASCSVRWSTSPKPRTQKSVKQIITITETATATATKGTKSITTLVCLLNPFAGLLFSFSLSGNCFHIFFQEWSHRKIFVEK